MARTSSASTSTTLSTALFLPAAVKWARSLMEPSATLGISSHQQPFECLLCPSQLLVELLLERTTQLRRWHLHQQQRSIIVLQQRAKNMKLYTVYTMEQIKN